MLSVVPERSSLTPDRSRGVIVIKSDCAGPPFTESFHELESQDARTLAQSYAAQCGIAPAFINGNTIGPYPLTEEGLSLEEVKDDNGKPLPASHKRMQPACYCVEVPVCRPMR